MRQFVIWSIEHEAWWRPAWCGYTRDLELAGVYGAREAERILARANQDGHVNECAVPLECVRTQRVTAEAS